MSDLPAAAENIPEVTSTTNPRPQGLKRVFPFVLLILIVFLILVGFLFIRYSKRQNSAMQVFGNVEFANKFTQESYLAFLENGLKGNEDNFANITKAFELLKIDYIDSPTADRYLVLQKISKYAQENYANEFNQTPLNVPCRESACGAKANYSQGLSTVRENIVADNKINESSKSALLRDIDNAAFASGENNSEQEFASLSGAFFTLKEIWKVTGDEKFKNLANGVLTALSLINKGEYEYLLEGKEFKFER